MNPTDRAYLCFQVWIRNILISILFIDFPEEDGFKDKVTFNEFSNSNNTSSDQNILKLGINAYILVSISHIRNFGYHYLEEN